MFLRLIFIFHLSWIPFSAFLFASEMTINGYYQGQNIFLINPLLDSENEFCILSVLVNNKESYVILNSSAIEIDFKKFDLKIGDEINLVIEHKSNCKPIVLNPEALMIKSTFNSGSLKVTRAGMLEWYTTNEAGKLTYFIEQYKWNKWMVIGEIMGKGKIEKNNYSYNVLLNSGENRFRVKQVDYTDVPRYSREKVYRSTMEPVEFKVNKSTHQIDFTAETIYEIYSHIGDLIKKDQGINVDLSNFQPGEYYINYDNSWDTFKVK